MQCTTFGCLEAATRLLHDPHGVPCPGGYVCDWHGREFVFEHAEKLTEYWTARNIDEYGRVLGEGWREWLAQYARENK